LAINKIVAYYNTQYRRSSARLHIAMNLIKKQMVIPLATSTNLKFDSIKAEQEVLE
jgi:hypothetical protein